MGELSSRGRRYVEDAVRAFERTPAEVTLSILLAITFSIAVEYEDDEVMRSFVETAAAVGIAITAAWSATLLHALGRIGTRTRWLITGAGVLSAALYGILIADFAKVTEIWRAAALAAAAFFLLMAVPAFTTERVHATDRMREVDGRIVLRVIGVLLYGGALFAGLALALAAINTLFELDLESTIYGHVFGWIFLALVPWVVAGGLDDYVRPHTEAGAVARVAQRMAAFLVPPLLAIYYLILYAYAVRIAVTGEVPKNLLSPLVIAAGALGALALLLFDPRTDSRATMRPLRLAAPFFIPAALLGLWALLPRLDQYGWTEFRALRVIVLSTFGALATAATFEVLRKRRLSLHWLPTAIAAVLLLSAIGPWSFVAVSRRSQQERLADALVAAGFTRDASGSPADTLVAHDIYQGVRGSAAYLQEHHGVASLPSRLAELARGERRIDHAARLGLRDMQPTDVVMQRALHGRLPAGAQIGTADTRVYYVLLEGPRRPGMPVSPVTVTADSTQRLLLRVDNEQFVADMRPLAAELRSGAQPTGTLPPAHARTVVTDTTGRARGDLLVLELNMNNAGTTVARVVGLLTLRD